MSKPDGASARYFEYFQQKAASGTPFEPEDDFHLVRTDAQSESANSPYRSIAVATTFSKEPHSTNFGLGFCVRRALREALNIDVINLPRWVSMEDLKSVCQELNLVVQIGPGQIETIIGRRYIVIYETGDRRAHAIVSNDLRTQIAEG